MEVAAVRLMRFVPSVQVDLVAWLAHELECGGGGAERTERFVRAALGGRASGALLHWVEVKHYDGLGRITRVREGTEREDRGGEGGSR